MLPLALVAAVYLIGSIPFSFLVVRILRGTDIREHGSGNVGATNVLRNFGKGAGAFALGLDLLKGWVAVTVARMIVGHPAWPYRLPPGADVFTDAPLHPSFWIGLSALIAVLAHIFPIWLGFRGGKGVATAAGAFLALSPIAMLGTLIVFLATVAITRYVSLASILAAAAIPLILRYFAHAPFWIVTFSILIAIAIILKHRGNISRLANGEERKFGESKGER